MLNSLHGYIQYVDKEHNRNISFLYKLYKQQAMLVALNLSWSAGWPSLYPDTTGLLLSEPSDESRAVSDRDPRRRRMSTQRYFSSIGRLKRPYTVQGFYRCGREVTSSRLVRSPRCSLLGDGAMLRELLTAHNSVICASILWRKTREGRLVHLRHMNT